MKKFEYALGGVPDRLDHLVYGLNGIYDALGAIVKAMSSKAQANAYRLYGAVITELDYDYNVSEGYIVLNNEVYYVPAHSVSIATGGTLENYWRPEVNYESDGTVNLQDGGTANLYHNRIAKLHLGNPANETEYYSINLRFWYDVIAESIYENLIFVTNLAQVLPKQSTFQFHNEAALLKAPFAEQLATLSFEQTKAQLQEKTTPTITLINSWSGVLGTDYYMHKDFLGTVHLYGTLTRANYDSSSFTLFNVPDGFKPVNANSVQVTARMNYSGNVGGDIGVNMTVGQTSATVNLYPAWYTEDVTITFSMSYYAG
jgi:hypothetical protein